MKTTVYLHGSKDTMWELGEKLGLSEEAVQKFKWACCEVKIELEVNPETGDAEIVAVDGRELKPKGEP